MSYFIAYSRSSIYTPTPIIFMSLNLRPDVFSGKSQISRSDTRFVTRDRPVYGNAQTWKRNPCETGWEPLKKQPATPVHQIISVIMSNIVTETRNVGNKSSGPRIIRLEEGWNDEIKVKVGIYIWRGNDTPVTIARMHGMRPL